MTRHRVPLLVLAGFLSCALAPCQQAGYRAGIEPATDTALSAVVGGAVLRMPGIAEDYVLLGDGQFVELPNGTTRLTARIARASVINAVFVLDLRLSGRVDPGTPAHPPAGSPRQRMLPQAYAPAGPVDPAQWRYYTAGTGTLTGIGAYDGARIDLTMNGSALQVGAGASHRNAQFGLSGVFNVVVAQHPSFTLVPSGPAEIALDLRTDLTMNATHVVADAAVSTLAPARAVSLPGLANDYVFVPVGGFAELGNGTAELRGTLLRLASFADAWDLTLTLAGRVNPGTPAHPPANSPVLGLAPGAYANQGGPVDPTLWRYYTTATGSLVGRGTNAGGTIALATRTAFQVGTGANQATLHHGLHGTTTAAVTAQPAARTIALTGPAEWTLNSSTSAVLPDPVLQAPANPTLPTVTDLGITLTGSNLAWVEQIAIGTRIATPLGSGGTFLNGWFRVQDQNTIELHPPQAMAPAAYPLAALNRSSGSNQIQVTMTAPTIPTLRTESTVQVDGVSNVVLHKGNLQGPVLAVIGLSMVRIPSVLPGIANIGIGNQFASLFTVPGSVQLQAATGAAIVPLGPIPASFVNTRWYYQAVMFDLAAPVLPLHATDIWTVDYR